ncbi:hypothetical protein ABH912_005210 [Pseudomonas sp. BT76 TE3572]
MPSLRHCSGGPPPSAIHGRGRLPRHPCRGAPCATPAFGLWERGGRSEAKAKQQQRQDQKIAASLRSTAPTGGRGCTHASHHSTGRALARLPLLILMHRRLERPSGGSAQWATRHGCRVSRPRPWMADGGGPTEQDRSEGMPSLGEAPNESGKSALVTFALFESDSL